MGHLSSPTQLSEQTLAPYTGATSTDGTPIPGDRERNARKHAYLHIPGG